MKPLIGITMSRGIVGNDDRAGERLYLHPGYADMISSSGGTPILIPPHSDPTRVLEIIDGLLIPGGADFKAEYFGQEDHPETSFEHPARFPHELQLLEEAEDSLPVLGICYGCQAINIWRGGDIHQHLPDVDGRVDHTGHNMQDYTIDEDSAFGKMMGSSATGSSNHHQAIDKVGDGLKAVAHHEDGTIEAIEDTTGRWMFGVQWHPERSPETADSQRLFNEFIRNAAARKFGS